MKIFRLLARVLVAKPKICLFLAILFCAFLGFFAPRLEIDASTQTLLLEHDKDLELFREVSKRYETQNFLLIAYTPKSDLLSDESLELIKNLSTELMNVPSVNNILSILNAPLLANTKLSLSQIMDHIPNLSDENISKEKARAEFLTSPFYKNQLVSSDFKTTAIVVNLKPNDKYNAFIEKINALEKSIENLENNASQKASLNTQKSKLAALKKEFKAYRDELRISEHNNLEQIKQIIAKYNDNSLFLGGMDMIADDMISFVKSDLGTYGIATLLLTMLCLCLYYLQLRYVFIAIFICVLCVLSASGLFGLLGFEITVISSNYIALQLIITLSVTIHLINSYREFSRKKAHFSTRQITYLAIKDRFIPCFFAIFTTALGFISLVFCDIKPVASLGIMMSASICVSLLICFWVFASLMCLLPKKPVNTTFENFFTLTKHCAKIAINPSGRKFIYITSTALFIIGIWGMSKLEVENSFIGYFKKSTDIYKGMEIIDTKLGGTVPLDIVISFDKIQAQNSQNIDDFESEFADEFSNDQNKAQYWFNERRMNVLRKVSDFLESKEFIGSVNSLNNLLKVGKDLNEGRQLDALALGLLYNGLSKEQKNLLLTPFVSIENDELHFSIRSTDSAPDLRRAVFLKELQSELNELVKNDGAKVEISGVMKLYANMLSSLFASQIDSLAFVILSLFATFIVIFRSLKLALIAIIINIVPLSCVLGAMGLIGLPLDIMSITIGSISLGIGVDNVIHYIYRYKKELAKSKDALIAVTKSHASIGYAMYYTSFAIFMGFGVMVTSNFWPTIYFGLLTDLVMFFMLISGFLLLPTLLISTKKLRF